MADQSASFPHALRHIARVIGEDKTLELVAALGGTEVYVAKEPKSDTPLVQVIGEASALQLGKEFGGTNLELPLAGKAVTLWLSTKGKSHNEIARIQRISRKTVGRRLGTTDSNQLDFFKADFLSRLGRV